MNLMTAIQDARRAGREKFIADNELILHHIGGGPSERIEQWDWQKKHNGGRYDHYLMIQVWHDESWSVSLKVDVSAPETEYAADLIKILKATVAVDGWKGIHRRMTNIATSAQFKEARLVLRLSVAQCADLCGVDARTIRRWE